MLKKRHFTQYFSIKFFSNHNQISTTSNKKDVTMLILTPFKFV